MSLTQQIITVGMVVLGTMLTRFLPFIVFPPGRQLPKFINYLGKAITPSAIGMLVVHCLRNTPILTGSHGIPELISIVVVVGLHLWKRQMLLSITAGTVVYMMLVQLVFKA